MLIAFLTVSIVLQLLAAVFALCLVGPSRGRWAWILISLAFTLRAFRLIYQAFLYFHGSINYQLFLWDELLGLLISAILLAGVWRIRPLFQAFHEAEQERELYAHAISHDLRSPLTVIKGFAEMLVDRFTEKTTEPEVNKAAIAIVHSSNRMEAMISDLVDAARVDGRQMELDLVPLELEKFFTEVIQGSLTLSERNRVGLEVETGVPPIMADRQRIERVLVNLLANALKYSPRETPVLVRSLRKDEIVEISVTDRGPGISTADLPHVFERYYRSQFNRKKEGTGLGLYISRLLVEAHGGSIWAENNLKGGGATFTFTLPVFR
jgi:signal transduction histidine kinase